MYAQDQKWARGAAHISLLSGHPQFRFEWCVVADVNITHYEALFYS